MAVQRDRSIKRSIRAVNNLDMIFGGDDVPATDCTSLVQTRLLDTYYQA